MVKSLHENCFFSKRHPSILASLPKATGQSYSSLKKISLPIETIYKNNVFRQNNYNDDSAKKWAWTPFIQTPLQEFFKNSILTTLYQSFSNMDVPYWVEEIYPENHPFYQTVIITSLSASTGAMINTVKEWQKEKLFYSGSPNNSLSHLHSMNLTKMCSPDFIRTFSACCARNYWAAFLTYGGIYSTEALLQKNFSEKKHTTSIKISASLIGSGIVQPIIMPLVVFQAYVLHHANIPFDILCKTFLKECSIKAMTQGSAIRIVQRTLSKSTFFLAYEILKQNQLEKGNELENNPVIRLILEI